MIIELTIENFKSFLDATTVRFAAGTTSKLNGNLLRLPNGERYVKSMALYGFNASGKTTILDGLYALGMFLLFSSKDQKPTAPIPSFESFALDSEAAKRPARVALTIELNGDRFTLDVSATASRVWNETLSVQRKAKPSARKSSTTVLLDRRWNPVKRKYSITQHDDLGPALTRQAVAEQTTPNRLMLGKLASLNSEIARRIVVWVEEDLEFYDMHRNFVSENAALADSARLFRDNENYAAIVTRLMSDADIGIQELRVIDEKVVGPVYSEEDKKLEFKESVKPSLSFRHYAEDGSEVFFRWQRESSGTLRFVALLAAVLQTSQRRRLVCIDELSASMHPRLVASLVQIVHSSKYNPTGNQLLFTTHDTHLMDPGKLLRRDQIILCHKNRYGRSTAVRLDEFQDSARSDANLQKQYLEGRFGGIPQFGPALEDVHVDDRPLEVGT